MWKRSVTEKNPPEANCQLGSRVMTDEAWSLGAKDVSPNLWLLWKLKSIYEMRFSCLHNPASLGILSGGRRKSSLTFPKTCFQIAKWNARMGWHLWRSTLRNEDFTSEGMLCNCSSCKACLTIKWTYFRSDHVQFIVWLHCFITFCLRIAPPGLFLPPSSWLQVQSLSRRE